MYRRRGSALVELLLMLSACSVILTLSAALIHRAMHAQTKSRLMLDVERSSLRLGEHFRRDVHAATAAAAGQEAGGEGVLVRLELGGGGSIEYRHAAGRVERMSAMNDMVHAREAFVFPAETQFTAAKGSSGLVILSLATSEDTAGDASSQADRPLPSYTVPAVLRIEAAMGQGARFVDAANARGESP